MFGITAEDEAVSILPPVIEVVPEEVKLPLLNTPPPTTAGTDKLLVTVTVAPLEIKSLPPRMHPKLKR